MTEEVEPKKYTASIYYEEEGELRFRQVKDQTLPYIFEDIGEMVALEYASIKTVVIEEVK